MKLGMQTKPYLLDYIHILVHVHTYSSLDELDRDIVYIFQQSGSRSCITYNACT